MKRQFIKVWKELGIAQMFPADTLANYTGKFCIKKIQVQRKYIKLNVICKIFDETKDLNHDSGVNNLL